MVARLVWDQKVGGSNPSTPTIFNHFCNNMQDFSSTISQIVSSTTIKDMIPHIANFFDSIGVKTYNFTTLEEAIMYHNYDQSWCERYYTRSYNEVDPAINIIKIHSKVLTWGEACNKMTEIHITPAQKVKLLQMQNSVKMEGLEHGICIPISIYPFGQNGFYLSLQSEKLIQDTSFIHQLLGMCMIFNNAFEDVRKINIRGYDAKFPFSQRETELIKLIYNGKERSDIADIMDVSINTVDTLTKRIFAKVRVNTKVQLITKILVNGWSHAFVSYKN